MVTSLHKGIIRTAQPSVANGPIETSVARDVSINNVLHAADSAGQTAIALSTLAGGEVLEPQDVVEDATWQVITTHSRLVTPVTDAGSYYFRVRIGGRSSLGDAVKFRVSLSVAGGEFTRDDAADYNFETDTTTSTTSVWLTGSSQGSEAWSSLVHVPSGWIGQLPFTTTAGIGGASVTGRQYRLNFVVWGYTANKSSTPQLTGLYLCPFVGV